MKNQDTIENQYFVANYQGETLYKGTWQDCLSFYNNTQGAIAIYDAFGHRFLSIWDL